MTLPGFTAEAGLQRSRSFRGAGGADHGAHTNIQFMPTISVALCPKSATQRKLPTSAAAPWTGLSGNFDDRGSKLRVRRRCYAEHMQLRLKSVPDHCAHIG